MSDQKGWGKGEGMDKRTVDIYRPYRPVVSIVGPETLSIVGEPDVDGVVLGAGKEEITLLIEFYLR